VSSAVKKVLAGVFVLLVVGGSSAAFAEPVGIPAYDGGMTFAQIAGPAGPEEYSWEVQLHDGQQLKQIDERSAEVFEGEHSGFGIVAEPAHDAVGSTVPTTLNVSGTNVVTLTVHHRAGNPAAGGGSFVYPITAGRGWEGGFQTQYVDIPDEPRPDESGREAIPSCVVPGLKGMSLKADRWRLRQAGCRLGAVRGRRLRGAKVVRQDVKVGTVLVAGSEVSVKLGG
jgi:hypothetical protein